MYLIIDLRDRRAKRLSYPKGAKSAVDRKEVLNLGQLSLGFIKKQESKQESIMPKRQTKTADGTRQALKNISYEQLVRCYLMQDGWQLFSPDLDHGHQTDLVVSDGPKFYRIQVKTVEAKGEGHSVERQWTDESHLDVIVYFARNSSWGYVAPAFQDKKRPLNHPEHFRFKTNSKNSFLKAFHSI